MLFEKFWMLPCSSVHGNSCCDEKIIMMREGKIIMTKEWQTKETNEQAQLVS
jgi:hypothetical protein